MFALMLTLGSAAYFHGTGCALMGAGKALSQWSPRSGNSRSGDGATGGIGRNRARGETKGGPGRRCGSGGHSIRPSFNKFRMSGWQVQDERMGWRNRPSFNKFRMSGWDGMGGN